MTNKELIKQSAELIKEINACVKSNDYKKIKNFWLENQERMSLLLKTLGKANLEKVLKRVDFAVKDVLLKTLLIKRSKRLMSFMQKTFERMTIDRHHLEKYKRRSKRISRHMKEMGFVEEEKVHAALFKLHAADLKHELEQRVSKLNEQQFFANPTPVPSGGVYPFRARLAPVKKGR